MPTYCTKQVAKLDENTLEYIIVSQKSACEEFDPIIKKLIIKKIFTDGVLTHIQLKGYNFDFAEFRRVKLLLHDWDFLEDGIVQQANIVMSDLPKDLSDWH